MDRIQKHALIDMLQDVALNPDMPPSQRLAAARTLLDKSVPNLASVAPSQLKHESPLSDLTSSQLTALLFELSKPAPEPALVRPDGGDGALELSDPFLNIPGSDKYAEGQGDSTEGPEGLRVGQPKLVSGELIPAVEPEDEEEVISDEYSADLPW